MNDIDETLDMAGLSGQRDGLNAAHEQQIARITGDKFLSDAGKADRLKAINDKHRADVLALIDGASGDLNSAEQRLIEGLERERAASAAGDLEVLGAPMLADLIARDLRGLETKEIIGAVQAAPRHPWTQRTMQALAVAELRERLRAGDVTADIPLVEMQRLAEPVSTAQKRAQLRQIAAQRAELRTWHPDRESQLRERFNL